MLRYPLLHPPLLAALASSGHGSQILIADGNYPHRTGLNPGAALVHLNLRPGLVTVDDVLETILSAIPVEAAAVMQPEDGSEPEIFDRFRELLPQGMDLDRLDRFTFYAASRGRDVAVGVATGEQRRYANILLTVGVVA